MLFSPVRCDAGEEGRALLHRPGLRIPTVSRAHTRAGAVHHWRAVLIAPFPLFLVCVSVYRRLLELERKAYPNASPSFRSNLRSALKQSIRAPDQAISIIARNPSAIALLGQVGQMKGVTEEMRKKVMDGFSALVKSTPGLNEAELWKKAKEEESRHTETQPQTQSHTSQR